MSVDISRQRTVANLPNVFIIGIQKAGTTSLYNWIGQHPEIYAPLSGKDFHFFSNDGHYNRGLSGLMERYNDYEGEPIVLTAGVNYSYFPFTANRIKDYYPQAKHILVMRDPVRRAWSAYHFMYKMGFETAPTFEEAIEKERKGLLATDLEGQSNRTYLAHGLYANQLENFWNSFPREQVLILFYEEMMQEKDASMKKIFDFLGVDNTFVPSYKTINETGKAKFIGLNRLVMGNSPIKSFFKSLGLNRLIPVNWRFGMKRYIREKNTVSGKGTKMTQVQYDAIAPFFTEDINQLSAILGRNLKELWKF